MVSQKRGTPRTPEVAACRRSPVPCGTQRRTHRSTGAGGRGGGGDRRRHRRHNGDANPEQTGRRTGGHDAAARPNTRARRARRSAHGRAHPDERRAGRGGEPRQPARNGGGRGARPGEDRAGRGGRGRAASTKARQCGGPGAGSPTVVDPSLDEKQDVRAGRLRTVRRERARVGQLDEISEDQGDDQSRREGPTHGPTARSGVHTGRGGGEEEAGGEGARVGVDVGGPPTARASVAVCVLLAAGVVGGRGSAAV